MRIPKTVTAAVVTAVILLTIGSIFLYRTAKWALGRVQPSSVSGAPAQPASVGASAVQVSAPETSAQPQSPVPRTDAMAQAFRTGKLPSPFSIPSGSPDDAAVDLAKKIAAADEQSTAALMTAIQMSGFSIRGKDGAISVTPRGPTQGMSFDAFSVASMAKLYSDGWAMSLDDLSAVLDKAISPRLKQPIAQILLSGITRSAQGDQPLRFWARMIVELGRQASPPYDLTDPKLDPTTTQLNAIQVSFILQRIAGDLSTRGHPTVPSKTAFYRPQGGHRPRLEPAVFHPSGRAHLMLAGDSGSGIGSPCGPRAETLMDAIAILKSTVFGDLAEGAGIGRANAAIAILRFIYIYAAMNVEIKMDNPPLVRTADGPNIQDKGETRTLTAHVWFEIHDWPCILWLLMRGSAGRNGLDVGNLPHDGAAEGIGVEWELIKGGVSRNLTTRDPGFLESQNSAIVMFDNGPGSDGATWNKETDANGDSPIKVSGRPQRWDMTHMKRFPVKKKMSVLVKIAYKHNGTADKLLSEFLDVLGPALGFAKGDILGGLVGAVTETMFRMHWYSSGEYEFPVQDWVPCKKGWGGTITYNKTLHTVHQSSNGGPGSSLTTGDDWTESATLTLSGSEAGTVNGGTFLGDSEGIWSAETSRHQLSLSHSSHSTQGCQITYDEKSETVATGSGNGDLKMSVSAGQNGPSAWRYQVVQSSGALPTLQVKNIWTTRNTVSGQQPAYTGRGCTSADHDANDVKSGAGPEEAPIYMVQGSMDPDNPNEIHDSQTVTDPQSGVTTRITVNLLRCEK